MLCSECNKNNAEIFINKIENGVSSMEGLCRDCAKKKGIDIPPPPKNSNQGNNQNTNMPPINNIDLSNMSKQLESLFKDLSSNIKMENLEELSPEELARAFLGYYNRGLVNGLFLSSGISGDVDSTMEKQIETVHLLRNKYGYDDYIHLKVVPGASKDSIKRAMALAN